MLTPDAYKRLEQLNRGKLKHADFQPQEPSARDEPPDSRGVCEPSLVIQGGVLRHITLEEAVPGQETRTGDGEFLLIRRSLLDMNSGARDMIAAFRGRLRAACSDSGAGSLSIIGAANMSKILFLDIETCGLSAVPLFLIGVAYFTGDDFIFLQLFARDYDEERPVLSFFNRFVSRYDVLVTYNGKSFDMPFIAARGHANRVRIPEEMPHVDLLHEVRRRWGRRMPDCRLQTVEQHILGRRRSGDIPGSEIPQAYHNFVLTRNAVDIKKILEHNISDIAAMIEILMRLPEAGTGGKS